MQRKSSEVQTIEQTAKEARKKMWDPHPVDALYANAVLVGIMAGMALQIQISAALRFYQKVRRYIHEIRYEKTRKKVEDYRD